MEMVGYNVSNVTIELRICCWSDFPWWGTEFWSLQCWTDIRMSEVKTCWQLCWVLQWTHPCWFLLLMVANWGCDGQESHWTSYLPCHGYIFRVVFMFPASYYSSVSSQYDRRKELYLNHTGVWGNPPQNKLSQLWPPPPRLWFGLVLFMVFWQEFQSNDMIFRFRREFDLMEWNSDQI